ncbi:MAG: bifunctional oligoribonuclease/PAP phosphatase NrnA [Bacillota bacterium]|nr:bifunctional oligoribonuclease/PAP phosphatase NrnA [Bacillota bacterium]
MKQMNSLSEIARCITERDRFVLTGHISPDGDCIGSLVGLYLGLKLLGKKVDMLLEDPVPPIYHYLHGVEAVLPVEYRKEDWDTLIFLDCSDAERAGQQVLDNTEQIPLRLCIDHHMSNEAFADLNYVDSQAAATAEIVYELLGLLDVKIDEDIANALYVGIVQDTGNFKHASTTSKSFQIAAQLLDRGADISLTKQHLFESKDKKEILFLARALSSLRFSDDVRIAWMTLTQNDLKELDAEDFQPEGIINYTLMTKEVEVGLFFREIGDQTVKVGFRSKGEVNVAELAERFGGGGHRQASGARIEEPLKKVEKLVLAVVKDVM